MKLESSGPQYPSQVVANKLLTHFVRNETPTGTYQIAKVLGEKDYEVLFAGTREEGEAFLRVLIDRDYPDLMKQP
jgi:hypothetical protein